MTAKRRLGTKFLLGLALAAVAALACGVLFFTSSIWGRFEDNYPQSSEADLPYERMKLVVLRDERSRAPSGFYDSVEISIGKKSVYLKLLPPYGLLRRPFEVPIDEVVRCDVSRWMAGVETNLWLASRRASISISDQTGKVLSWCKSAKNGKREG